MNNLYDLQPSRDGNYALIVNKVPNLTKEEYLNMFKQFGDVVNMKENYDYIFVRYKTKAEVISCMKSLNNTKFNVRPAKNKPFEEKQLNAHYLKNKNITDSSKNPMNEIKNYKSNKYFLKDRESNNSRLTNNSTNGPLVLGKRSDTNTHLFIANLSEKTTKAHLLKLLKEYIVINLSDIYQTLPHQRTKVNYVVVTMPVTEAIQAMSDLNFSIFMEKCLMVMEVQTMYYQAISPIKPNENKCLIPPKLEEMELLGYLPRSNSSTDSLKHHKSHEVTKRYKNFK